MNNRLASALKFTPEDLQANRSGRISVAQRTRHEAPRISSVAVYVLIGHGVVLMGLLGTIALIVNKPAMWGVLLIVAGLAMLPFFAARNEFVRRPVLQDDVNRGSVAVVTGDAQLPMENQRYHVRVGNQEFRNVSLKLWGAFRPGVAYHVYYLPQSRIMLSAEGASASG